MDESQTELYRNATRPVVERWERYMNGEENILYGARTVDMGPARSSQIISTGRRAFANGLTFFLIYNFWGKIVNMVVECCFSTLVCDTAFMLWHFGVLH